MVAAVVVVNWVTIMLYMDSGAPVVVVVEEVGEESVTPVTLPTLVMPVVLPLIIARPLQETTQ